MTLRYRVIVVRIGEEEFEGYVRAFPSLSVTGKTPAETLEAARIQIEKVLADYARIGRRPPPADRDAVLVQLVEVSFAGAGPYQLNVHVEVTTGAVRKDAEDLSIRGSALALVVSLAAAGRDMSIDTLCERLYPDVPPEQAYDALKMCVYRVRKQLGSPGVIQTTQRGYRLSDDVVTDVRFLPQIVRAIRMRSVPKAIEARLDSIFSQLCAGRPAAYAAWNWYAAVERNLWNAAREIGMYLADRALRDGDLARALDIAQQLARLDPLDETAHELAIRVHLARGDRGAAMQRFREYAADLQEQHGMEPSAALRALVDPLST